MARPFGVQGGEALPLTQPTVSAIIPTRNRAASLARTLVALARQDRRPDEVLVVDASDRAPDVEALPASYRERLNLRYLHATAGVCAQRNFGIRQAIGSHVLLCDDDIEPPADYIQRLVAYLEEHPSTGAVTGMIAEADGAGGFTRGFTPPSFRHLLFSFVFQLTVWSDVAAPERGGLRGLPLRALARWYRRRGNTWTAAGWPLVTQIRGPVLHTATYGLGATLVRRRWLLDSPYDERLGPHGIGDNYGVALGFPGECPIAVLTDLPVLHHRAAENRLNPADTYFDRVLALDYFIRTSGRFSRASTAWLAWSLVGKSILFMLRGQGSMLRRTVRALGIVLSGSNPLLAEAEPLAGAATPARDGS